jgi:hypothetical protein
MTILPITAVLTAAVWLTPTGAVAQTQTLRNGIYTCVDAKGRKLTSDRPIPECNDREQKVLNPSGTLQAKVGPSLTAQERADQEAKDKLAQEEKARKEEDKRRERALLLRYPSKAVHDDERAQAIKQVSAARDAAVKRAEELFAQRKAIDAEMEFYKKDPNKAPPALKHQVDEVFKGLAEQGRFIADQDNEMKRVNARFDAELLRLTQLWAKQAAGPVLPGSPARTTPKS